MADPLPAPSPRFAPGENVRVKADWPELRGPSHIRTPGYLRGRFGRVERVLGAFPNPEDLAFARPAAPVTLYHVQFPQPPLFAEGQPGDDLLVEIFEHWLEPLEADATLAHLHQEGPAGDEDRPFPREVAS